MRILVTGGAGFIGSNIAEALVGGGHDVIVLDNFSLGSRENLSELEDRIEIVEGDVRNTETLEPLIDGADYVFHEAARSSAPMFDSDPRAGVDVNVNGFLNVLELSRRHDVSGVIYASTSSLYGGVRGKQREDAKVVPPNFYSATKLAREHLSMLYTKNYGLPTVGFRYFSVYGPHERPKGRYANIISQFLWEMMEGRPPVIYGDGTQSRDFTFVADVVSANVLAMEAIEKKRKGISGESFNVGTGRAASFNDIIKFLNAALGKNLKPKYVKNEIKNYVQDTLADLSKAKKFLGYSPKFSLKEGIEKTIEANQR